LYAADVAIKLSRALPQRPGDALGRFRSYGSMILRVASMLPSVSAAVSGVGEEQRALMDGVFESMYFISKASLERGRASPAVVDLLRSVACGSEQRRAERSYVPRGGVDVERFPSHRYCPGDALERFGDALAQAELAHAVNLSGRDRMRQLKGNALFYDSLGAALETVSHSLVMWVFPVLFDGLRLLRGIEMAAGVGAPRASERRPFGLDHVAPAFLSDGETVADRQRTGRAAQFLIAAMYEGAEAYFGAGARQKEEWKVARELERRIGEALESCRRDSERACLVPGKSMRVIVDIVAQFLERSQENEHATLALKLACAVPCLLPSGLPHLEGYDGGLLSVWDACNHLLGVNAACRSRYDPPVSLLCSVLGGVVGNLVSPDISGPYVAASAIMEHANRLQAQWPGSKFEPESPDLPAPRTRRFRVAASRARSMRVAEAKGKHVGANAAICDAITRRCFKPPRERSLLADARHGAALTMHAISAAFADEGLLDGALPAEPGCDPRPSDGIVPLKRLYLIALGAEPGLPVRKDGSTPFVESGARRATSASQADAMETPWRDVAGAALLLVGPLYSFTKQAFEETLLHDWAVRDEVKRAIHSRAESGTGKRAAPPCPVMLPSRAMQQLSQRALRMVEDVVTQVNNGMQSQGGPPRVSQALDCFAYSACAIYEMADYGPFWESCILHLVSNSPKRARPAYVRAQSPSAPSAAR
jgi:hypothetical protein